VILCRVLGPVEVLVDGATAPPELLWKKHLALLIYLARSPRRVRTREHLTGMLWPDKDEAAARHSLNEALRVIRKATGDDAVETVAGQVRLAGGVVRLDADDLELRAADGDWAAGAAIVGGEFLEGFSIPGSHGFEDWLAQERRYWVARSTRVLLAHGEQLLGEGRAEEALAVARRAETADPDQDQVARAIMTGYAIQGDSIAALDHFTRFTERRAGGEGPGVETRLLADRIRSARSRPVTTKKAEERRRAPLVGRAPELAVLIEQWDRCRSEGCGTALLLLGEDGSGKTRLLEEFLSRVRLAGGTTALVRAVQGDGTEPGEGLLGLARGGLLDAPGLSSAAPDAIGYFAARIPEWADRFPRTTPGGTLATSFSAVVGAPLGEGAVVLAVDDAQWFDHPSFLTLLATLRTHAGQALCVVLSAQPQPPSDDLDELRSCIGGDVAGAVLTLRPLSRESLSALAVWALPEYDSAALARVVRRVEHDSAGLPFLVVELLSAVAHGLDLAQDPVPWPPPFRTLSQTMPGDLPDSVTAAMRIGFRRLSKEAQLVLAAASVLGEHNTEVTLGSACGLEPAKTAQALDELEWQRWLETDARGYAFVARLAGLVIARDMVTPGQRLRFEARVASADVLPNRSM